MSPAAIEMFSTFGVAILCITIAIMALAIFFHLLSYFTESGSKPDAIAIRGVLKKDTWATVHMSGSDKTFERVKFIGFTNTDSFKTHLPHQLNGMVILEDPEGCQFLVRAKSIRMIVVPPKKE